MGASSFFPILQDRVRRREFNSLFLFVTSRCNSLCRTCFYFDKLNSKDDLTFDEIAHIAETAPPFRKLWLSGGEPFLRDRLAEIVSLFVKHNGVHNVNLPTNGMLPERIFAAMDRMLELCPETSIDLNFSLDGMQKTHDSIRGVPKNFERTLGTMRAAAERYRGVRKLRRNVLTVITRENYGEVEELAAYLKANVEIDGQYFEVVRGQAPDPSLKEFTRESLEKLHGRLMGVHAHYADGLFKRLPFGARQAARLYYLGNLRFHFDLHEACFESPKAWPMPCTAGETSIVIDHNGRFRACEMRDAVGDLHDYDFDVRRALESAEMRGEVAAIPGANCWCTHSCFIQESSKFSAKAQLWQIPRAGLSWRSAS
ncbi:MAG TPA: radical SAM protein [Bryobacteraceae bacterium]|jgi:MoaA/NifB/PqqE/SkfB family radical SAM enzyme|nr:radical SAM protein [Bryobacteraceae bacterium]